MGYDQETEEPLELEEGDEVVLESESSIWRIKSDSYHRSPREDPLFLFQRETVLAELSDLKDHEWHPHEGVWANQTPLGYRLRIMPAGRPEGSVGIVTGIITGVA